MNSLFSALVPAILAAAGAACIIRGTELYDALTSGAADGLKTAAKILPPLVILLTAIKMLRASGALGALETLISPAAEFLGIPAECIPITLIRPLSGSAALALAADIIAECGADSIAGRTAAVMLGSSETTFYVLTVYFGAAQNGADEHVRSLLAKKSRLALPAALTADIAGFCSAALFTNLFYG